MPVNILTCPRGPSAFLYRDPEGAPASNGVRYHAALDWFCPGGAEVRSPVDGEVVEVRASRGTTGQVFGGVVKVREGSGRVYVMRHVDPATTLARQVRAGERVARVTNWADGPDHVHLEVWRSLSGGYRLENMIDPGLLDWTDKPPAKPKPKLPHGSTLRLVVGSRSWAGWDECAGPLRWVAAHGIDPAQDRAAIAWKGSIWRGPGPVTNVARNLTSRFLEAA